MLNPLLASSIVFLLHIVNPFIVKILVLSLLVASSLIKNGILYNKYSSIFHFHPLNLFSYFLMFMDSNTTRSDPCLSMGWLYFLREFIKYLTCIY